MNPVSRAIFDRMEAAADEALTPLRRNGLTVVEVGCGQQTNVVFEGATRVIGVDVDQPALVANTTVTDPVILSANELELAPESVDAISSIFTLEHVEEPDVVFGMLARALRPGGVLVIAVPQVRSPKAIITKFTPQSFHEWFYRRALGRDPGAHGTPFDTVLDPAIAPERLRRLATALGLDVIAEESFEDNKQRQVRTKVHLNGRAWAATRAISRALLRHDAADTDYIAVYRRSDRAPSGPVVDLLRSTDPVDAG
jgi:SAM-dependent methyltransferase